MLVGRKRARLVLSAADRTRLETIRRSRTEEKRRTVRAAILLDAADGMADKANAAARRVNRNTVVLCVRKYLGFGLEAALGELPRSGKPRQISDEALAWIQNLACQKPNDLGYAQELWTYKRLIEHVHRQALAAGHGELARLSRSKLHKILTQGELKPHTVRYYVERRNPEFEQKMAAVLHVYKEVEILNHGLVTGAICEPGTVTVSYAEKPGIQALAVTTPDRPPVPGLHASPIRDQDPQIRRPCSSSRCPRLPPEGVACADPIREGDGFCFSVYESRRACADFACRVCCRSSPAGSYQRRCAD